jgi:hypothetical protein
MDEIIFLVEESPEGGYEARALEEAIFTEAETLPELKERVRDAVRCHFDEAPRPPDHPPPSCEGRAHPCMKLPRDLSQT